VINIFLPSFFFCLGKQCLFPNSWQWLRWKTNGCKIWKLFNWQVVQNCCVTNEKHFYKRLQKVCATDYFDSLMPLSSMTSKWNVTKLRSSVFFLRCAYCLYRNAKAAVIPHKQSLFCSFSWCRSKVFQKSQCRKLKWKSGTWSPPSWCPTRKNVNFDGKQLGKFLTVRLGKLDLLIDLNARFQE